MTKSAAQHASGARADDPTLYLSRKDQAHHEANEAARLRGQLDPEWASRNPQQAQAALIDLKWEDFANRFRPIEDSALAGYMASPEEDARRAGLSAATAFSADPTQAVSRDLGRFGASLTPGQAQALSQQRGLDAARGIATAENTTRRHVRDRNMEGMATMIGIGRDVQGSASDSMSQAAGMQAQRNAANKAASAQRRQQNQSMAIGVLTTGAMIF